MIRWILMVALCQAAIAVASLSSAGTSGVELLQPSAGDDEAARAEVLYRAQDWRGALELYRIAVSRSPDDPHLLDRSAHCSHQLGDYEAALATWGELASVQPQSAVVHYNLACANARLGRIDAAFAALQSAATLGFKDANLLLGDADLAKLRADPRFGEFRRKLRAASHPPPPEIEQFAFWIGAWDVFDKSGVLAGSSRIERILGGHVILENWTGADGMQGKSFNTYDPLKHRWQQRWVDDTGKQVDFDEGHFAEGVMTFDMGWKPSDGTRAQRRMTFTDLGDKGVRQHSQGSLDGGSTWTEEYDLFYRRAAARPVEVLRY